jgi:hypothetical protein
MGPKELGGKLLAGFAADLRFLIRSTKLRRPRRGDVTLGGTSPILLALCFSSVCAPNYEDSMRRFVLIAVAMLSFLSSTKAADVGRCFPKMSDFEGSDLQVFNDTWDINRAPDTGGANKHVNLVVPADRVVVDWDAVEESCIRCDGHGNLSVYFEESGAFRLPKGVHAGVRFNAGCLGCSGASFTGRVTCVHVSKSKWLAVFIEKYADCNERRAFAAVSNAHSKKSASQILEELVKVETEARLLRDALSTKPNSSAEEKLEPTPAPKGS